MTLKDILSVMDRDTNIVICDNFGPHNDVCPADRLPLLNLMGELNRKVERIYLDLTDESITIELEDFKLSVDNE